MDHNAIFGWLLRPEGRHSVVMAFAITRNREVAMDIIKGLDRIILVLAIISMPLNFVFGTWIYYDIKIIKVPKPEFLPKPPRIARDDLIDKLKIQIYGKNSKEHPIDEKDTKTEPAEHIPVGYELIFDSWSYKEYGPPLWHFVVVGLICAVISFPVVFFGLRGLTRGTRWFFLWIFAGFKDEKKK